VEVVFQVVLIVVGVAATLVALDSAVRTFVLPRGAVVTLTRAVSVAIRAVFRLLARAKPTYEGRDRLMALYSPVAMLALVSTWLVLVLGGFTCIFYALVGAGWDEAFTASGSSLFTLGFERPPGAVAVSFLEAAIGLTLLALLISYLPAMYSSFSRREVLVARSVAWAGEPPSAANFLIRMYKIDKLTDLDDVWEEWQRWFAELAETHTSMGFLNFFRSPDPHRSWVTAAGAAMDSAALVNSTVDVPWQAQAGLTVRGGFTALRSIAGFFRMPFDPDPAPDDPISIAREEWDELCRTLEAAGVPLKADRDQAWRDFAGWRVNYDTVLVGLAGLVMAPYAPWSSDRSVYRSVRVIRSRRNA
jgi:hypothetical protein